MGTQATGTSSALERVRIVDVAQRLGLTVRENGNGAYCRCPVTDHEHDHKRPACHLGGEKPNLWNCFKCGASGDAVALVKAVKGCETARAFDWLRGNGFLPDENQTPLPARDPIQQLSRLRSWEPQALDALNVETDGRVIKFPMRDHAGNVTGFKSRRADNSAFSTREGENVKSLTGKGEKHGLFYPDELEDSTIPVLVCEGEADTVAALSAGYTAVVGMPGACVGRAVKGYLTRLLAGRDVILAPDPDEAGRKWRDAVGRALLDVQCEVSYIPPDDDRDLDDRLRYGDVTLADLIADALDFERPAPTSDRDLLTRCTDAGNAEWLAALHGDRLRYDHRRGRWLLWQGDWWAEDSDGKLRRMAKEAARERYRKAADIEDAEQKKAVAKWAIKSESRSKLDAALALAQSETPIADSGESWNADPFLLGVQNGVVNLRTGQLRPGKPEDGITLHTDIAFDADAECPRWEQFVGEIFNGDSELIDFIQRAVGYSLTGDVSEQCLFTLHGRGANGKSTFLRVLRHVFGGYAQDTPFTTFELAARNSTPNDLAALAGRRFVTAAEAVPGRRLNEARVKALTGGDPMTARFLYGEYFTFEPECKLWLAVNHRPNVGDHSIAFWRRMRLVPFTRQFIGVDADDHLGEKLQDEAPGILAWAVRGCLDWQNNGLGYPDAVADATEEYQHDTDPLGEFLQERCQQGNRQSVKASEFYRVYCSWCEANGVTGREKLSKTAFGRRLSEWYEKEHRRDGNYYVGVGLCEGCEGF